MLTTRFKNTTDADNFITDAAGIASECQGSIKRADGASPDGLHKVELQGFDACLGLVGDELERLAEKNGAVKGSAGAYFFV